MPTVNEISHEAPSLGRSDPTPREFDILDVALIFAARKWTILLASAAGFVIGLLLVLQVAPTFTAKSCPPSRSSRAPRPCWGSLAPWLP
jgi:LPS O-antigen subunit length determinant protein (WzzB/FepE family)